MVAETPARLSSLPSWRLARAAHRSHQLLTAALAGAGARGYDYRVLTALAEYGPSSQAEIGRRVELDRSDTAATVRRLEEAAAVRSHVSPDDRRRNVVELTATGRRRLDQLDRVVADVQSQLLERLTDTQRRSLLTLLDAIGS